MKSLGLKMRDEGAQGFFQMSALHDHIDHVMLQQKFRSLKLVRQLLFNGLLDKHEYGKTDQRFRFGQNYVPPNIATLAVTPRRMVRGRLTGE